MTSEVQALDLAAGVAPVAARRLVCNELSKSFGGVRAVNGVNVEFLPGEVSALLGPNGAGKTTLFNLITCAVTPDEGRVILADEGGRSRVLARSRRALDPWRVARLGVGRLFQDVRSAERLSVLENVMCGFSRQFGENPLTAVFGSPWVAGSESKLRKRAMDLLEFTYVAAVAHERAGKVSFGQQKLMAIARLLATGASVLLLDEPTSGINPNQVEHLLGLLRRLAGLGYTVVMVEHNLDVAAAVADSAHYMVDGRLVLSGVISEVLSDSLVAKFSGARYSQSMAVMPTQRDVLQLSAEPDA